MCSRKILLQAMYLLSALMYVLTYSYNAMQDINIKKVTQL